MKSVNKTCLNLVENNQIFQLRGFSISEINRKGNIEIIFQKGIGVTLTKKIIDLYQGKILFKRQGYILDEIGHLNVYIHFFDKTEGSKLVITYIDKIDNSLNYNDLYQLSKRLFKFVDSSNSKTDIGQVCTRMIEIPKVKIVAIFIIDKAGFLYFSKVNENRAYMANNNFQIAGFISAILMYSQDFIEGENYGLKLEDIDLGNGCQMFLKTKKNVIFAYIVEKINCSENIKRYMQLIFEEFLFRYYSTYVVKFKGDLSPFHDFEKVIDDYFEI